MKSFIPGALLATVTLSASAYAQEPPPGPPVDPPPATPAPDGEANAPAAPAPPAEATEPAAGEPAEATAAGQLGVGLNGADAKVEGEANPAGSAPADDAAASAEDGGQPPVNLEEYLSKGDELEYPGYIPGYRQYPPLGMSPYSPSAQPPVSGTPSFGAPTLTDEWTFRWTGYMNASLQFSLDERPDPNDNQSAIVVNTPPSTVDEWWSFNETSTVPGNWVGNNFIYGNKTVSATVSIDTWQPSNPATYYQLGSQYFINKSFLKYTPEPVAGIQATWLVGYYNTNYGVLGKWGGGLYSTPITVQLNGIGEALYAEYELDGGWNVNVEHGIMADRQGRAPDGVVADEDVRWVSPYRGSSWINHTHLGLTRRGNPELRVKLHHIYSFSADDRAAAPFDNIDTRAIDESNPPDAKLHIFGFDAQLESSTLGFLGIAASYTSADQAWQLRGFRNYGGDGEDLTKRYLGEDTGGSGELLVAGLNWAFRLNDLTSYPGDPPPGDTPGLTINTGFHFAHSMTDNIVFDGRSRFKYGVDADYRFLEFMGVALRVDHVMPNSKDSGEDFVVLAPRLTFHSHWWSHEQISLRYGKWFYGPRTRTEATGDRSISRIDDQFLALNFNMYW